MPGCILPNDFPGGGIGDNSQVWRFGEHACQETQRRSRIHLHKTILPEPLPEAAATDAILLR